MKRIATILAVAAAFVVTGYALAQTPAPAPAQGRGAGAARPAWMPGYVEPGLPRPPYMPPETPLGTGPYKAIMTTEPGAEEFGAYYPANLGALGARKLPVLVWGNGSCAYLGNRFRHFLTDIASYGYLALAGGAIGAPNGGENETITMAQNNALRNPEATPQPEAAPDPNRKAVTVELLSKGVDWAIAENKRAGSKFFGKLDTSNIAVMGQSCGGGLAAHFGNDPRVKTIGTWSGATWRTPEIAKTFTKPVLIVAGDARYDVDFYAALELFERVKNPSIPVFFGWRTNMSHLGTYRAADGGELSPVARSWLDWQLKGDLNAAKMFVGENCGLCTNTHWHIQRKNIK